MAHRVSEPDIYSGYVISMIGQTAGQKMRQEYKVAQANVAAGTARWDDDESDFDKTVASEIARRGQEEADRVETDRLASEAAKLKSPASVEAALWEKVRPIKFVTEQGDDSGKVYLSHPFPQVVACTNELVREEAIKEISREGDQVIFTLANAVASYNIVDEKEDTLLLELSEAVQPDVAIPSNWRDRAHLANIAAAKRIRGTTEAMSKPEAEAILEEWTKNDRVSTEDAGGEVGGEGGAGGEATTRIEGHDLTAEQIAARDEAAKRSAEETARLSRDDNSDDGFGA